VVKGRKKLRTPSREKRPWISKHNNVDVKIRKVSGGGSSRRREWEREVVAT